MSQDHLPAAVGLCPRREHTSEFYIPLDVEETQGALCPDADCNLPLVIYRREDVEQSMRQETEGFDEIEREEQS